MASAGRPHAARNCSEPRAHTHTQEHPYRSAHRHARACAHTQTRALGPIAPACLPVSPPPPLSVPRTTLPPSLSSAITPRLTRGPHRRRFPFEPCPPLSPALPLPLCPCAPSSLSPLASRRSFATPTPYHPPPWDHETAIQKIKTLELGEGREGPGEARGALRPDVVTPAGGAWGWHRRGRAWP